MFTDILCDIGIIDSCWRVVYGFVIKLQLAACCLLLQAFNIGWTDIEANYVICEPPAALLLSECDWSPAVLIPHFLLV